MLFFEENMSKFIYLEDFYLRYFQAIYYLTETINTKRLHVFPLNVNLR